MDRSWLLLIFLLSYDRFSSDLAIPGPMLYSYCNFTILQERKLTMYFGFIEHTQSKINESLVSAKELNQPHDDEGGRT